MPEPTDVPLPPAGTAAAWLAAGPGRRQVDLAVLGVPTRAGVLGGTRAHTTPRAVRRALAALATSAPDRGVDVSTLAAYDVGDVDEPEDGDEGEWRTRIAASGAAQRARLMVALGGTGNLTAPVVDGVHGAALATTGLVLVDARHDLGTGRGGSAALARCLDLGVPGEHIVVVGAADWAEPSGRGEAARARGVRTWPARMLHERGAAAVLADALDVAAAGGGRVHVSLDLGACEQSAVPGCAGALPGGLGPSQLRDLAHAAGRDPRVASADIVEVDAAADAPDGRTVRLAALTLLELAGGLAARE